MPSGGPARTTIHRTPTRWGRVAGLLGVIVVVAAFGDQVLATSTSRSPAAIGVPAGEHSRPRGDHGALPREHRGAPDEPGVAGGKATGGRGEAGGATDGGTTVLDVGSPGVANLDPALLAALRRAATDAADDGVEFVIRSGWRSPEHQQRLLDEAVLKYGSEREAARWVAPPGRSAHVSGDAVDVGPFAAAAWLSRRGAEYGLCQIYGNEPWHYELRPQAAGQGCPSMYADPTQDPRLRP